MGQPRRFALRDRGMDHFSADADARDDDALDANNADNAIKAEARVNADTRVDAA